MQLATFKFVPKLFPSHCIFSPLLEPVETLTGNGVLMSNCFRATGLGGRPAAVLCKGGNIVSDITRTKRVDSARAEISDMIQE